MPEPLHSSHVAGEGIPSPGNSEAMHECKTESLKEDTAAGGVKETNSAAIGGTVDVASRIADVAEKGAMGIVNPLARTISNMTVISFVCFIFAYAVIYAWPATQDKFHQEIRDERKFHAEQAQLTRDEQARERQKDREMYEQLRAMTEHKLDARNEKFAETLSTEIVKTIREIIGPKSNSTKVDN